MNKLKKTIEFQKIYKNNKKINTKYTIIFHSKSQKEQKFGFVSSKKTGNSVKRNRNKRLMREFVRKNIHLFDNKTNYILVAKSILKDLDIKYQDLEQDILKKLK